jgi:hypothetical protein
MVTMPLASADRASAALGNILEERENRQLEVAGIAGTSTPSLATSNYQLGFLYCWPENRGAETVVCACATERRPTVSAGLATTTEGQGLSPPALVCRQ